MKLTTFPKKYILNPRSYIVLKDKCKKMIPEKYHKIVSRIKPSIFEDNKKVRITNTERFYLEVELLLKNLEYSDPLIYDLVVNHKPTQTAYVNIKNSENYYTITLGSTSVKCSSLLYLLSPKKLKIIKYSYY